MACMAPVIIIQVELNMYLSDWIYRKCLDSFKKNFEWDRGISFTEPHVYSPLSPDQITTSMRWYLYLYRLHDMSAIDIKHLSSVSVSMEINIETYDIF